MELQFEKSVCSCLRKVVSQVQNQEQTQELRLPDAMPDIGRVLGCWGQILIRGKEWRTNAMSVSGGVMVWVLYAPEDGTECRTMETWIPFQIKWDLPDTQRDGTICILPLLKSVDARSISARKLMLRSVVSVLGEAMEPVEEEVYMPLSVPEDVQLLKQSYPMELPLEAGEKSFQIEEVSSPPNFGKIVRYELMPQITEQKVMTSRLIFRGTFKLHMLYMDMESQLQTWDTELAFAQYTDLDKEYGSSATAWIIPIVNGSELEPMEDGNLLAKVAMTAQYVIYDRQMIEVVEDAYSTTRQIMPQTQSLQLPMRLDMQTKQLDCPQTVSTDGNEVMDVAAFYEHPSVHQIEDTAQMEMNIQYLLLSRDGNGNIHNHTAKGECHWEIPSDPDNRMDVYPLVTGSASVNSMGDSAEVTPNLTGMVAAFTQMGIPMVTSLELGAENEPDPNRPSLILRRAGEQGLWSIAKECGTTVDAILMANHLQQEPTTGQMLLIPVS